MQLLDSVRSQVLRRTLRVKGLRDFYRSKAKRTLLLFLVSLGVNAFLVIQFPFLSFYVTPLVLGIPHLYASLRYGGESIGFSRYYAVWMGVFLLQILQQQGMISVPFGWINALGVLFTLLIFKTERQKSISRKWFALPLILASSYAFLPFCTSLFLAVAHNFLAFIFWYHRAKSEAERKTVWNAVGATLAFSAAFYFWPASDSLGALAQDLTGVYESHWSLWFTSVFLLSQSVHYFIWLKAIPDAAVPTETPLSFRNGDRKLREVFGNRIYLYAGALFLALLFVSVYFSWEEGRRFYVHLSAYHGLAEIAFLATILQKGKV